MFPFGPIYNKDTPISSSSERRKWSNNQEVRKRFISAGTITSKHSRGQSYASAATSSSLSQGHVFSMCYARHAERPSVGNAIIIIIPIAFKGKHISSIIINSLRMMSFKNWNSIRIIKILHYLNPGFL